MVYVYVFVTALLKASFFYVSKATPAPPLTGLKDPTADIDAVADKLNPVDLKLFHALSVISL